MFLVCRNEPSKPKRKLSFYQIDWLINRSALKHENLAIHPRVTEKRNSKSAIPFERLSKNSRRWNWFFLSNLRCAWNISSVLPPNIRFYKWHGSKQRPVCWLRCLPSSGSSGKSIFSKFLGRNCETDFEAVIFL